MDSMGSNERRVVHEHLRDRPEIETYSEATSPTATWSSPRCSPIERGRGRGGAGLAILLDLLGTPAAPISAASVRRAREVHADS